VVSGDDPVSAEAAFCFYGGNSGGLEDERFCFDAEPGTDTGMWDSGYETQYLGSSRDDGAVPDRWHPVHDLLRSSQLIFTQFVMTETSASFFLADIFLRWVSPERLCLSTQF
jgi:hypothetical protein